MRRRAQESLEMAPIRQGATDEVVDDSWEFASPRQIRQLSIQRVQLIYDVFGQKCLATSRRTANPQVLLTIQESLDARLIVRPVTCPRSRLAVEKEAVGFI